MIFWLVSAKVCTVSDSKKMYEDIFLVCPVPMIGFVHIVSVTSTNSEVDMRFNINHIIRINNKTCLQICIDYKLLNFDSVNGLKSSNVQLFFKPNIV